MVENRDVNPLRNSPNLLRSSPLPKNGAYSVTPQTAERPPTTTRSLAEPKTKKEDPVSGTLSPFVARGGFEPPRTAPKAAVLPLDDRAFSPVAAIRYLVFSPDEHRLTVQGTPPSWRLPPFRCVVARGGFEPPHTDPESAVLPLDDRAKSSAASKPQTVKIRSRPRVFKHGPNEGLSRGSYRLFLPWRGRRHTRQSGRPSPQSASHLFRRLPDAGRPRNCLR